MLVCLSADVTAAATHHVDDVVLILIAHAAAACVGRPPTGEMLRSRPNTLSTCYQSIVVVSYCCDGCIYAPPTIAAAVDQWLLA